MDTHLEVDIKEKNKARIATAVSLLLFFLILFLPWFTYQNPPPGQEGTIINLGTIDFGQGSENAPESSAEAEALEEKENPPTTSQEESQKEKEEVVKPKSNPEPKEIASTKKVITDDTKDLALAEAKKKKEKEREEKAKKEKREQERVEKLAAAKKEREAKEKRIAEEIRLAEEKAAKEKAAKEAKLAEANDHKNYLKDLFGKSGEGEGKGNTGESGNQGTKDGDPNASAVEGISSGSGVVSGGLAGRGGSGPGIKDNSNKAGTIMIKVCVNGSGKVISANYTQRGSTIVDPKLKKLAEDNAFKWNFKSGSADKQCGFIKYEFKVE